MPHIVNGSQLTPEQREQALTLHLNRDTTDSPWNDLARLIVGKGPATQNDEEWVNSRTWEVHDDGRVRLQHE